MNVNDLAPIPKVDDIVISAERLKMGLVSRATGGGFDQKEYSALRKKILSIPGITEIVPKFLKLCFTVDEFWDWIKNAAPTYHERRTILAKELNPILEFVEYESGAGAIEFKKQFEDKGVIGNGGFGLVYLYEHILLKRLFAVKVFAPSFYAGGEKELERFFQEANMLFRLNHPCIIKVYDAGLMGKRPFIRMEYFDGKNLNQILQEYGIIPPDKALHMMKYLVDAMRHAHEDAGIIHRDLKPSNIMAKSPNIFRIIDFGLGIFVENELHSRFTKTGDATISGYYNAPELVQNPKLIDKRTDIYSLGAIWFTMLTGQPPAGTSIIDQLQSVGNLSKDYIACIQKCLASIDHRYTNCMQLQGDLQKL